MLRIMNTKVENLCSNVNWTFEKSITGSFNLGKFTFQKSALTQ